MKLSDATIDRCCAVAAAILETERAADGRPEAPFWRGASEEQRSATREMVAHLLTGGATSNWIDPKGGERLRRILLFVVGEYEAVPS